MAEPLDKANKLLRTALSTGAPGEVNNALSLLAKLLVESNYGPHDVALVGRGADEDDALLDAIQRVETLTQENLDLRIRLAKFETPPAPREVGQRELLEALELHGKMDSMQMCHLFPSEKPRNPVQWRLSGLAGRGYIDNVGTQSRAVWQINDKGRDWLNTARTKVDTPQPEC